MSFPHDLEGKQVIIKAIKMMDECGRYEKSTWQTVRGFLRNSFKIKEEDIKEENHNWLYFDTESKENKRAVGTTEWWRDEISNLDIEKD